MSDINIFTLCPFRRIHKRLPRAHLVTRFLSVLSPPLGRLAHPFATPHRTAEISVFGDLSISVKWTTRCVSWHSAHQEAFPSSLSFRDTRCLYLQLRNMQTSPTTQACAALSPLTVRNAPGGHRCGLRERCQGSTQVPQHLSPLLVQFVCPVFYARPAAPRKLAFYNGILLCVSNFTVRPHDQPAIFSFRGGGPCLP